MTTALSHTEAQFQGVVLELAQLSGWTLRYHTYNSKRSPSGFPDLVLVKAPRVVFAELKRNGEYPTAAQRTWLLGLHACGQEVALWRPADLDEVVAVLRRGQPAGLPAAFLARYGQPARA